MIPRLLAYVQNYIEYFFSTNTYPNRAARFRRKQLGGWNASYATKVWITKEGHWRLREMGDDHLENTIKFLIRKATRTQADTDWRVLDACKVLTEEQRSQPFTDYVFEIYWDMMKEYEFRGLSIAWLHPYVNKCILGTLSEDIDGMANVINDELQSRANPDHGY